MSKAKPDFDGEIPTYCQDELTCPYCGEVFKDCFELADFDDEMECYECGKRFTYERVVEVTYTSRRNDPPKEPDNG